MSLPWWTMLSITAAAIWSSPNTDPHLLNSGFVVIAADCLSYASAKTWKSSLAPSASSRRNPSSLMTSKRALPMSAASRLSLPLSPACLRRITSEDAVKKRASSLLSLPMSSGPAPPRCASPVRRPWRRRGRGRPRRPRAPPGAASRCP